MDLIDTLAEAGFLPTSDAEELELGSTTLSTLRYYLARGWDAFRAEDDGTYTLYRTDDGTHRLLNITATGLIAGDLQVPASARGDVWLCAVIGLGPEAAR